MLKWGNISFEEYYNLFAQKKDESQIKEAFLIDAMKKNINYNIQILSLNWQKPNSSSSITFHNYIKIGS